MRNIKFYITILLILPISMLFLLGGCGADDNNKDIAQSFLNEFLDKNFDNILNNYEYNASMATALSEKVLNEVYSSYIEPLNQLKSIDYKETQNGTVSYLAVFESGSLILKVVFNNENKISGFFIEPYENLKMPENIKEKEIRIGRKYQLKGTLTEPKDKKTDTVVILVHGSGPSDRDESIGALKPFRDIAWGLAQKGIAVYRYDKRTYTYAEKLSQLEDITVYDEVIEDVIYAYNKMNSLGYDNIYIAGHSLGGYLMGRISEELSWAEGYIILAGNVTPLQDLLITQVKYLAGADGEITKSEQAQINIIEKQSANINALQRQNADNYSKYDLLNVPASYWLDLKDYDPIESMKKCRGRVLILQGAKDYQVTSNEYAKWQNGLKEKDNVEYILYENLNHLFMPSKVMSADDYTDINYVDYNVINDINIFINK